MATDNLLTQYNSLIWYWNGEKQKLGNMTDKQLYYLLNLMKKSPGTWHNIPSNTWTNNINYILAKRKQLKLKYASLQKA